MKSTPIHRRFAIAHIASVLIATSVLFATPPAVHAEDTLSWKSSERDLVDGETVTGYTRVIVESSLTRSSRYIILWCVYLDGQPLTGPSYKPDFQAPSPAATTPVWLYYDKGVVTRSAGDQSSPGCWTPVIDDRAHGLDITLNTSMWSNGSHTIKIEATANDNTTHSKTSTVLSQNSEPTVEWTTPSAQSRTPEMTLEAKITPTVDRIVKMCLTRHNTENESSSAVPFVGTHSSEDGCKTVRIYDAFKGSIKFIVNTLPWPSQPLNLTLTIEDQVGRQYKTSFAIPAVNHTLNLTPLGIGTDLNGWIAIRQNVPPTDKSFYKQICVQAFGSESCTTETISGTTGGSVPVNTACFANASQVVTVKGTTSGAEAITKTFNLTTKNSAPTIRSVSNAVKKPTWRNSTVSSTLTLTYNNGCTYAIALTNKSSTKTYKGILAPGSNQLVFNKLKPNTAYTAKVTVTSPHGARSATKTFTTPAIPPRPRPSGGGSGGGSGSGGGYGYSYVGQILSTVPSSFTRAQASSCWTYGYENGGFGIWAESNWVVVGQSGYTVYACKFR